MTVPCVSAEGGSEEGQAVTVIPGPRSTGAAFGVAKMAGGSS